MQLNLSVVDVFNLTKDWLDDIQTAGEWGMDDGLIVEPDVPLALEREAESARTELQRKQNYYYFWDTEPRNFTTWDI